MILTVDRALVNWIRNFVGLRLLKVMSIFLRSINKPIVVATSVLAQILLFIFSFLLTISIIQNLFAFLNALLLLHLVPFGQKLLFALIYIASSIQFRRRRILFADVAVSDSILFFYFPALFL
jgi:hypothetical protein